MRVSNPCTLNLTIPYTCWWLFLLKTPATPFLRAFTGPGNMLSPNIEQARGVREWYLQGISLNQ
jgi:hypothetical protein